MDTTKTKRNSNLEILRIIAMLLIIIYHLVTGSFEDFTLVSTNFNNYFIYFISLFGKIGVDVFILITAYFMINSKFKLKKLFVLGGEVYFYSILFLILFLTVLTPAKPILYINIIQSILPLSHSLYWFITDYIVLMLLSPFLNVFIKKISKKNLLKLIILTLIIWSIFPTFTGPSFDFNQMIWFIVLYLIGSFIRLYLDFTKIKSKYLFLILIVSLVIGWLFICVSSSINILSQFDMFKLNGSIFNRENSIFVLFASLSLFLLFLKRKEFSNKYINYIAGSVLGVYLIHSNIFAGFYVWLTILNIPSYYYSPYFIVIAITSTILVYLVCTGIDIVRRVSVEKIWIWFVDNKLNNIINWIYNKFYWFENKIKYYLKN